MDYAIFLFMALALGGVVYAAIRKRKLEQAVAAFAAANGWQPLTPDDATLWQFVPDALMSQGDSHSYDMAYRAHIGGHDATLFTYQYDERQEDPGTMNSPASSRTVSHGFTIAGFTVSHSLTSLYVRRRSWDDFTGAYKNSQKLQLEGDFNKHFDVFVPEGTEVEALTLLTPEVMEFIEQAGRDFDIQISDHAVTVIADENYMSPSRLPGLITFMARLVNEWGNRSVGLHPGTDSADPLPIAELTKPTLWSTTAGKVIIFFIIVCVGQAILIPAIIFIYSLIHH